MDTLVFQNFKSASNKQLQELKPSDIVLHSDDEVQANYTLVAVPTTEVLRAISYIQSRCPDFTNHQYVYPDPELHLTVMGRIDITVDIDKIRESVKSAIQNVPIAFRMFGVASNAHAVSISCYPHNFDLFALRQNIRSRMGVVGDDYSIHLAQYEHMGWINFMRYLRKPSEEELDQFRSLIQNEFGLFKPTKLQLFRNRSKSLRQKAREFMEEFVLP